MTSMTSLQEFLQNTGRTLDRVAVDTVAGSPISIDPVSPWQPVGAPLETEQQRILAYPEGAREITIDGKSQPVTPNLMVLVSAVTPAADPAEFVDLVVDTSAALQGWTTEEDLAGESDTEAQSSGEPRTPVVYRYLAGRYNAEVGETKTSSMLAGWNSGDTTYVFQAVATTFEGSEDHHESALESVRIGEWTLPQLITAMRG
ncbi:hypothetical protein [Dietzia sp.]|uniref:hypothetical protein n=1 Tax=Dietzia sp. TaxID=1871616 RepID=UPI002FD9D34A